MALTGRTALIAALGALLVGLVLPHWLGLLAVEIPLLLTIVYDLARATPVDQMVFTRSGDTSVRLGEQVNVSLVVTNPTSRPLHADLRDAWPPSSWPASDEPMPGRHKLEIAPGERQRITTTLHPTRRGDRRSERITVRSYGPLRLAARQGHHDVPWTVRVLPAFTSRKHLPGKLARLRELDGRTSILTRGEGTEFDSLREYVPGDDTRSIDWRATARHSTVAVRTWRPERDRRVLLVLDTGRTSAGRVGDIPRLDVSMDAALLLGALASRAGDRVNMLAYDRALRATVNGRTAHQVLSALVDAMAPLEPALLESDPRGLDTAALRSAPRQSLLILFTGLDPAPVEEGLLPVLPLLTQRHTVVVAAISDPRVQQMAHSRGTVDAVYEAAAASQTQAERHHTADLLRRHGAIVVDALPTDLAPTLANTYLGLKAAGKL